MPTPGATCIPKSNLRSGAIEIRWKQRRHWKPCLNVNTLYTYKICLHGRNLWSTSPQRQIRGTNWVQKPWKLLEFKMTKALASRVERSALPSFGQMPVAGFLEAKVLLCACCTRYLPLGIELPYWVAWVYYLPSSLRQLKKTLHTQKWVDTIGVEGKEWIHARHSTPSSIKAVEELSSRV